MRKLTITITLISPAIPETWEEQGVQGTRSGVYTVYEHRSDEDDTEICRSSQVKDHVDDSFGASL